LTRLAYTVDGSRRGRPVVLLHPWFGCAAFWDPVRPVLTGCRVITFDLYSPAAGDWAAMAAPEAMASAVGDVLRREADRPAVVIGNSMGGILAQLVAVAWPALVERLVLVGTGARSAGLQSEFAARLAAWLAAPDPRVLPDFTRGLVAPRAAGHPAVLACVERVATLDPAYLAAVPRAAQRLDLRAGLGGVRAPALVIRGELDIIRTRAHADELAASIPGARALEIAGAGHSPMVDSTDEFNRLLVDFLAGRAVRPIQLP
jgi:3-oxoadipate enol-lactonase